MRGVPKTADVTIVGAGIVGLATAVNLTERHPRARVVVLDKEPKIATHQTVSYTHLTLPTNREV